MEISVGELIDRITILEIKLHRLPESAARELETQLAAACSIRDRAVAPCEALCGLAGQLRAVNQALWDVEEELRICEETGRFGDRFVELARSVYKTNDLRAALKRRIDDLAGSPLREHKSHALPEV